MFLLEYDLVADYLERRSEFREDHLALATEAAQRGELVLGGALADPADRAILVWRVARARSRRCTTCSAIRSTATR